MNLKNLVPAERAAQTREIHDLTPYDTTVFPTCRPICRIAPSRNTAATRKLRVPALLDVVAGTLEIDLLAKLASAY